MAVKRWIWAMVAVAVAMPAFAAPQLTPHLTILAEERYDTDEIFRNESGQLGQFMSRLTPEVGGRLKDHHFDGMAFYAGDFRIRQTGAFTWEHRAGLSLIAEPSARVKLKLDANFWRVLDPTSLPRLGLARTFGPIVYGKLLASGEAMLTHRLSIRPGYQFEGAHVLTGRLPAGFVHAPFVGFWYGLSPRLKLGAVYRFQYFLLGQDGSLAHSPVAAVEWRATRHMVLTARAGPAWYLRPNDPRVRGVLPRASLDVWHDLGHFNWGLTVGHDLVGASGFTSALWADFISATVSYRFLKPWRVYAVANLFRNGLAPAQGYNLRLTRLGPGVSNGYAVEAGLEWTVAKNWMLQGTYTRIEQTGAAGDLSQLSLARNIALVRLVVTAL